MNVLSLDFDFFIREDSVWDFGHREYDSIFVNGMWLTRYQFIDLYNETRIEKYASFDPANAYEYLTDTHFVIADNFLLGIADSHLHAHSFFKKDSIDTLYQFDAHHDMYKENGLTCGNWLSRLVNAKKVRQVCWAYPSWVKPSFYNDPRDDFSGRIKMMSYSKFSTVKGIRIDKVFLCRSSVWTPPHHDRTFQKMAESFTAQTENSVDYGDLALRSYPTEEQAKEMFDAQTKMSFACLVKPRAILEKKIDGR